MERLERNAEAWAKYFHFVDHWQKPDAVFRGVSAIDDMLDQYVKSDVDPYLIVIDWWGIVRMMVLATCKMRDGQERRDFASLQLKHLSDIADKYNTRIIVFHQMGGKSAGKAKPGSMYEGQEDSNMGQFFDIAMTSDRPDKSDGTISFLFDKARMGAGGTVRQKLDGQRCMFVDPPDEAYMVSASSNISMPEDEPGSPKAMIAQ